MRASHRSDPDPTNAPPGDRPLSIGAFSRRSLLSPKALRLYDRLGLLRPDSGGEDNGYRLYRESQLEPARLIGVLRRLDMPLARIAEVLAAPAGDRAAVLAEWWAETEQRVGRQRALLGYLQHRFSGNEGQYDMFEIRERDIPEQLVLTEQRHITVAELSEWMGGAIGRHWQNAEPYGGISAPVICIFHGKVDEDSDGPVEVCGPIDPPAGVTVTHPTRIEPAHHEVYTRIRKSQVEFPQILGAYDAVEQWITDNGRTMIGGPREVYFTDFMAAGPDDEVTDIAWPIQ